MTESPQAAMMRKSRASSSFDPYELTCLLWGGQYPKYPFHNFTADHFSSERIVQERRAAFERVEKTLGTDDASKLLRCYSQTSREDLFEQGLEMGKACLDEMFEHGHEHFVWITLHYNLTNAR
jgi:acyl-CoA oxidase